MDFFDSTRVTFAEPIDMLYACHGKVNRFCAQLDSLPAYVAANGCTAAALDAMRQISLYFDTAAPLHHQDEEEDFFPLLLQYAPDVGDVVAHLQGQHRHLHESWLAVCGEFARVRHDSSATLDADVLRRFTEAYRQHLLLEEPLFERGRAVIPVEHLSCIGERMAARRRK